MNPHGLLVSNQNTPQKLSQDTRWSKLEYNGRKGASPWDDSAALKKREGTTTEASYELWFSEGTHHNESEGCIIRQADGVCRGKLANVTSEQHAAFHGAIRLVGRNEPGYGERAVAVLSGVYSHVELDLSTTPSSDRSELGLVISGPDAEVMVRTDGTVWRKSPHGEWSQEPIGADVGRQICLHASLRGCVLMWNARGCVPLRLIGRELLQKQAQFTTTLLARGFALHMQQSHYGEPQ